MDLTIQLHQTLHPEKQFSLLIIIILIHNHCANIINANNTQILMTVHDLSFVSTDDNEIIHNHSNETEHRSLLMRSPSRTLFIVPETRKRLPDQNIHQVRFINFTQILINRNRRLNQTFASPESPIHKPTTSASPSTRISNIRKKYIRLGGNLHHHLSSTTVPRLTSLVTTSPSSIMTTTASSIQANVREARTFSDSFEEKKTRKKKKTLVKVKVKNGDQQMLLYDHSTVATESTTIISLKELNRHKKQDSHPSSILTTERPTTTTATTTSVYDDELSTESSEKSETETSMPTTTESLKPEDVYETIAITLPPPYDDSKDDGYFKRRPSIMARTTTTISPSTMESTTQTMDPFMETFDPDFVTDMHGPMFHTMPPSPHMTLPHLTLPHSNQPIIPFMPRQCHFRIESICPTMTIGRRSQFQCFGDGVIHCDGHISRMCRLFERQSYLIHSRRHRSDASLMPTTDSLEMYRPSAHNYFYCNQPLMTDECIGVTECISDASILANTADGSISSMAEEREPNEIEYEKSHSANNQYEVSENDPEPDVSDQPPRYFSKFDHTTTLSTTTISSSTNYLTTEPSASRFDHDGHSNNHQSSSLRSRQHDLSTANSHHPSGQSLSRVQTGLIGALIALGSLMFVMVTAIAFYSFRKSRSADGFHKQWWLW